MLVSYNKKSSIHQRQSVLWRSERQDTQEREAKLAEKHFIDKQYVKKTLLRTILKITSFKLFPFIKSFLRTFDIQMILVLILLITEKRDHLTCYNVGQDLALSYFLSFCDRQMFFAFIYFNIFDLILFRHCGSKHLPSLK